MLLLGVQCLFSRVNATTGVERFAQSGQVPVSLRARCELVRRKLPTDNCPFGVRETGNRGRKHTLVGTPSASPTNVPRQRADGSLDRGDLAGRAVVREVEAGELDP